MKVALFSDLHLEFSIEPLYAISDGLKKSNPDVILLAGDITTTRRLDVLSVIRNMTDAQIIYTPGNHEFYGTTIKNGLEMISKECNRVGINFAVNEVVTVEDVSFICSVGWSDLKSFPHLCMKKKKECLSNISDFRVINDHTVDKMLELSEKDFRFIGTALDCVRDIGTKPVIMTHFAPIESCRNFRYPVDVLASYFSNDWRDVLVNSGVMPKAWVYGHTHANETGQTLGVPVFSNQSGYPGEDVAGFDPAFYFEV